MAPLSEPQISPRASHRPSPPSAPLPSTTTSNNTLSRGQQSESGPPATATKPAMPLLPFPSKLASLGNLIDKTNEKSNSLHLRPSSLKLDSSFLSFFKKAKAVADSSDVRVAEAELQLPTQPVRIAGLHSLPSFDYSKLPQSKSMASASGSAPRRSEWNRRSSTYFAEDQLVPSTFVIAQARVRSRSVTIVPSPPPTLRRSPPSAPVTQTRFTINRFSLESRKSISTAQPNSSANYVVAPKGSATPADAAFVHPLPVPTRAHRYSSMPSSSFSVRLRDKRWSRELAVAEAGNAGVTITLSSTSASPEDMEVAWICNELVDAGRVYFEWAITLRPKSPSTYPLKSSIAPPTVSAETEAQRYAGSVDDLPPLNALRKVSQPRVRSKSSSVSSESSNSTGPITPRRSLADSFVPPPKKFSSSDFAQVLRGGYYSSSEHHTAPEALSQPPASQPRSPFRNKFGQVDIFNSINFSIDSDTEGEMTPSKMSFSPPPSPSRIPQAPINNIASFRFPTLRPHSNGNLATQNDFQDGFADEEREDISLSRARWEQRSMSCWSDSEVEVDHEEEHPMSRHNEGETSWSTLPDVPDSD